MFQLQANPTFSDTVDIPRPGEKPEPVRFVFRHRTRDEVDVLIGAMNAGEKTLDDVVREIVEKWDVKDLEFSDAALNTCFQVFPGSALAIWMGYRKALTEGVRKKLIDAVRALYGARGGDFGLYSGMGMTPEQIKERLEGENAALVLWPENVEAVRVFAALSTQWRYGMAGMTGLDFSAIPVVMRLEGVRRKRQKSVFASLQIMEAEVLNIMRERKNDGR